MLTGNGRDYKDIPHLTEGDEEFRKKFLSWELGDLTYVDIQEYLKSKDNNPRTDGQLRAARSTSRFTPTPSQRSKFPAGYRR